MHFTKYSINLTTHVSTLRCYQPSPEESNVDDWGESVEELQDEGLEDESFFKTLV